MALFTCNVKKIKGAASKNSDVESENDIVLDR